MSSISPDQFREEAARRLIDTYELMLLLGLRNRQSIWKRVEAGTLPKPVLQKEHAITLWDRDEIVPLVSERVG